MIIATNVIGGKHMTSQLIRTEKNITEYAKNMPVTFLLIVICFLVFLMETVIFQLKGIDSLNTFIRWMAIEQKPLLNGEIWRIITSTITHATSLHLFSNMFGLLIFSSFVEGKLGSRKYSVLYIVCATFVGFSIALFGQPAIGMSGFVFATMMYCLLYGLDKRHSWSKADKQMLLANLLFNIVITFIIPEISIAGHLSGLVIGALSYYALNRKEIITT